MDRGLRYGLISAVGVAVLAIAAPFLLPASVYRSEIEQAVTRATGRNFMISGPLHFTLLPMPGLRADKVALANMAGGQARSMITADDVHVGVRFWPLFAGHIEVSEITLDRPAINLEVDRQGHANWITEPTRHGHARGTPANPFNAHVSSLNIVRGQVRYANQRSGVRRTIDDVDASADFVDFDGPAVINGSFTHRGEQVAFGANVATLSRLLQERTAGIDLSLVSASLRTGFKGEIAPNGHLRGHLQLSSPSVRRAMEWLGVRLPDSGGFGVLQLDTQLSGDNRVIELSGLRANFDSMNIGGNVSVAFGSNVPFARGALSIDHLNLNPYLEHNHKSHATHSPEREDEWSRKPFSVDLLKNIDASLTLNTGKITVRKLRLDQARINVALAGARLKAVIDRLALYGGTGKATLDLDANGDRPVFHNTLSINNVTLQPFLSDTIGVKQIEGAGAMLLDISSAGSNADAIMRGLSGKGSIEFRDGHIRGVDLGAVARAVQSLLGRAADQDAFTQYKTMDGTFTITRGVLSNQDFRLDGPLLSMNGSGAVDVGDRTIDFKVMPKASATIARRKLTVGVPFHIKGPWRHVHYVADVSGIVKGVLQNLETGRAPFKGMFGASSKPDDKKKKHKSLGDALKNMLGIH
jgi:AsmA protein